MRCPDCGKFVSMENSEDAEVNVDFDIFDPIPEKADGTINFNADVDHYRNCADCGTQLKQVTMSDQFSVTLSQIEEFNKLSYEDKKVVVDALANDDCVEIEYESCTADESGGGRYERNIITLCCTFTLTITAEKKIDETTTKEIKLTHQFDHSFTAAAGEYEECC